LPEKPVRKFTLWELVSECEHVCRELTEHYQTDYIPKLRELQRLVKPHRHREFEVSDITVANSIKSLKNSDDYARERLDRLEVLMKEMLDRALKGLWGSTA
jgi:hypothetical protein